MENKIKHVGIVESIKDDCVKVRIIQSSACSACKAAKQCHASESKEKIVDVFTENSNEFIKGQNVIVMASYNVGLYAVTLGMVFPMVLMILVLLSMTLFGYSEMTAAIVSLSSLIPYYVLLYLFRCQINRRVTFSIESVK